jgi:hypothetical protein
VRSGCATGPFSATSGDREIVRCSAKPIRHAGASMGRTSNSHLAAFSCTPRLEPIYLVKDGNEYSSNYIFINFDRSNGNEF